MLIAPDGRMRGPVLALFVAAWSLALQDISPDAVEAQRLSAGLAAFEADEYAQAAALLHAYVFDIDEDKADPRAQYALGIMHQQGLGATQDTLLACAFFDNASRTLDRPQTADTVRVAKDASAESTAHCADKTSDEEKKEIGALISLYREWPSSTEFDLEDGRTMTFDRGRIKLQGPGGSSVFEMLNFAGHIVVLAPVHTRIGGRDFFEFLFWWSTGNGRETHSIHMLRWSALELRGDDITEVAAGELFRTSNLSYPTAESTPALRDLTTIRLNAAGDVEWIVAAWPGHIVRARRAWQER